MRSKDIVNTVKSFKIKFKILQHSANSSVYNHSVSGIEDKEILTLILIRLLRLINFIFELIKHT